MTTTIFLSHPPVDSASSTVRFSTLKIKNISHLISKSRMHLNSIQVLYKHFIPFKTSMSDCPNKHTKEPNLRNIPIATKFVLGVTSPWMLLASRASIEPAYTLLGLTLAMCFFFSALFWANPVNGSGMHTLDKISARFFVAVAFFHTLEKPLAFLLLPVVVLIFFSLGSFACRTNKFRMHLVCHLLFRFFAFWWAFVLVLCVHTFFVVFVQMSLLYFGHVVLSLLLLSSPCVQSHFLLVYTLCISIATAAVLFLEYKP